MPGEEIDRLRSLLVHAHEHEQEEVHPSTARDSSPTSSVHDEVDRLRSLLAHVHDPEKMNPFHKLVSRITERFTLPVRQPNQHPGKNKHAA